MIMKKGEPSALSLIIGITALPLTMFVLIPVALLALPDYRLYPAAGAQPLLIAVGSVLALVGVYFAISTVRIMFAVGKGTPAPWNPPTRLIRTGLYSRTRNPMLTGGIIILLGEALIFDSLTLLAWAVAFFAANHIYFVFSEEPELEKRFGKDYTKYKEEVPRWLPRLRKRQAR
jgi:protein-S-isoprenylcysteine O-methyltransferase Ste14